MNTIKNIQSIRGMNDYLPNEIITWQYVENILKQILNSYGYKEIRIPIVENTSLFKRAIGKETDVVKKEMYTFKDNNGCNLTLRPEGTAGCVRACIEHGLLRNKEQRLWYTGPMFRHERPQKGRYRQFYQLGVEVLGLEGPDIDAELIMLTYRWWRALGISKHITLELNSIGSLEARNSYRNALVTFLEKNKEKLDDDCKRRMYGNQLRILDSKNIKIQMLLNDAPVLSDFLDYESRKHFANLCKLLEIAGINYTVNQRLVRGLDYYNRTVFEWVTNNIGSQETICAGGRYDNLVEQLGGHATNAVGLAVGLERLVLLIQYIHPKYKRIKFKIDVYLATSSIKIQPMIIQLAERIRDALPNIKLIINYGGGNLKKQLSRANKYGASVVLILDESEITDGKVLLKNLKTRKQITIMQNKVINYLHSLFNSRNQNSLYGVF